MSYCKEHPDRLAYCELEYKYERRKFWLFCKECYDRRLQNPDFEHSLFSRKFLQGETISHAPASVPAVPPDYVPHAPYAGGTPSSAMLCYYHQNVEHGKEKCPNLATHSIRFRLDPPRTYRNVCKVHHDEKLKGIDYQSRGLIAGESSATAADIPSADGVAVAALSPFHHASAAFTTSHTCDVCPSRHIILDQDVRHYTGIHHVRVCGRHPNACTHCRCAYSGCEHAALVMARCPNGHLLANIGACHSHTRLYTLDRGVCKECPDSAGDYTTSGAPYTYNTPPPIPKFAVLPSNRCVSWMCDNPPTSFIDCIADRTHKLGLCDMHFHDRTRIPGCEVCNRR